MKKIITSRIFSFILGAIIFSGVTVFAYSISSKDIKFTPTDSSWEVDNVEEAMNSLYDKAKNFDVNLATDVTASSNSVMNGNYFSTEYITSGKLNVQEGAYYVLSVFAKNYTTNPIITISGCSNIRNNNSSSHVDAAAKGIYGKYSLHYCKATSDTITINTNIPSGISYLLFKLFE